jgi:hypothetical protein
MKRYLLIVTLLLAVISSASAAEKPLEAFLPATCASRWVMDGKATTYIPETLYKYIDGEAELYLPYGFRKAVAGIYVNPAKKGAGIAATIFEMGSLLNAFGIYSNYRSPTLEQLKLGAEGFYDESQLMFYQDSYFVRIEASGSFSGDESSLKACAQAISGGLPGGSEKPKELTYLSIPGSVPLTEKYYAQGLLGHTFFGKGLTGELMIGEARAKSLLILTDSGEAARRVLIEYQNYLKKSGAVPEVSEDGAGRVLRVIDPLYKGVLLHQSNRYVVGVVGLKEPRQGEGAVARLLERLAANK